MQAVIFIGVQASGKSTFYAHQFFKSHVRLNLDMLRTRHREQLLLNACLEAKQPFVIDNTNPTVEDRIRYIVPAHLHRFSVIGYYFQSSAKVALERNANRTGTEYVPEKALLGTYKRLQLPTFDEGFDQLFYVSVGENNTFVVQEWQHEL
ncbi:MAG: ATP-binding protein [Chloroflexota bacterium]